MRVCIYGQSRTGSTVLSSYISNRLDLYNIVEPYNPRNPNYHSDEEIWLEPKTSVKFLWGELNNYQERELHRYFDKVIILTREDNIAGAESHLMGLITKQWEKYSYNIKEFTEKEKRQLQYNIKWRDETKQQLLSLPYFQVTYEEIFYRKVGITRINSYLNIEQDNSDVGMFDLKHKYRQDPVNKKSII